MRTITALITLALLGSMPLASADERLSDCETGQPWIGYRTTQSLRAAYHEAGSPGGANACEGEHWDGQDAVDSGGGSCSGAMRLHPSGPHASMCMPSDPNAVPGDDPLWPAGLRASAAQSATHAEAYTSTNVPLVGRAALHAGACTTEGAQGLEQRACRNDGEARAGVYVRDNTPSNIVWTLIRPPGLIPRPASESDCDQATYQYQAMTGDHVCARDNTAITIELMP